MNGIARVHALMLQSTRSAAEKRESRMLQFIYMMQEAVTTDDIDRYVLHNPKKTQNLLAQMAAEGLVRQSPDGTWTLTDGPCPVVCLGLTKIAHTMSLPG